MIDLGFWFMFPVATGIATIAMMAGIGMPSLFFFLRGQQYSMLFIEIRANV